MSALVWCPFPDRECAIQVADFLLAEQLIACANILGEMHSRFVWKGETGTAEEVGVLFKTDSGSLDAAISRIESLHPYETPAILGWKCDAANAATLEWLGGATARKGVT